MKKQGIISFLQNLQNTICESFENLEPTARFSHKPWSYAKGSGGGEMRVIRGDVFEKAAVNFSYIEGDHFPMSDGAGPFIATGVSLITHMKNPHAPTVHMNLRYMETPNKNWFGGGYDLTPMGFSYEEDSRHFHGTAQNHLAPWGEDLYEKFSAAAKEYFYIPHRHKERGVGGLFFDHFNTGNPEQDLGMWKAIGNSFLPAILPIYNKRISSPFSEEDKQIQLSYRAHYVEFNLIYDRGTKFGFLSGGNPEAILCSMPPLASW